VAQKALHLDPRVGPLALNPGNQAVYAWLFNQRSCFPFGMKRLEQHISVSHRAERPGNLFCRSV
jgi:hypothetical protein